MKPAHQLKPVWCFLTGRMSWPDIVQYKITSGPCSGDIVNYPPTATTHPVPSPPIPLTSKVAAKMIALGEIKPIPHGADYRLIIHDLGAYEALAASGLLYHPRHSGTHKRT